MQRSENIIDSFPERLPLKSATEDYLSFVEKEDNHLNYQKKDEIFLFDKQEEDDMEKWFDAK